MNRTTTLSHNVINPALVALIVGAGAIGFAPIFVKLSEVGPVSTAFWRMALALPFYWLWLNQQRLPLKPTSTWSDLRWLLLVGLFFAGDLAAWHWSLEFTTVSNSVILANCAPIFVTFGAWFFFSERFNRLFIIGLVIAIIGAVMLVGAGFSLNSQTWFGDLLAILTAMFYAGYILSVKQARSRFPTITVMVWLSIIASLVLLPLALISEPTLLALSWPGWLVLGGVALICQFGGQSMIAYALAHLPASFSSVTLLLQPVLATTFAWIILNETLGFWQGIGGVIVLSGIFLARRGSQL